MNEEESISTRHLIDVPGLKSSQLCSPVNVEVIVADAWGKSIAGQLTLVCLVNLLCRLTDVVANINIVASDVNPLITFPHQEKGGSLLEELKNLVIWAVADEVKLGINVLNFEKSMTLIIGHSDLKNKKVDNTFQVIADGWKFWVGIPKMAPKAKILPQTSNPLGPFLAASVLCGEVFKKTRHFTRGQTLKSFGYSIWSGQMTTSWLSLEDGPVIAKEILQPFYLIGAGAVGHALAYTLGSANFKSGYAVVVDDDSYVKTNLNRCFLAGKKDIGDKKVIRVHEFLRKGGLAGYAYPGTIRDYVGNPKIGLCKDLEEYEMHGLFHNVVSCVDKGLSRHDIQGLWPQMIFGGSTNNLTAKSIVYDLNGGTPCLGCHNPPEKDGEKIRLLEQKLRDFSPQKRNQYLARHFSKTQRVEINQYLEAADECGLLGEEYLRQFAIKSPQEFSVSFVSMASGVILAGRLISYLLFPAIAPPRPMMSNMAFLGGRVEDSYLSIDGTCKKCNGSPLEKHKTLWKGV